MVEAECSQIKQVSLIEKKSHKSFVNPAFICIDSQLMARRDIGKTLGIRAGGVQKGMRLGEGMWDEWALRRRGTRAMFTSPSAEPLPGGHVKWHELVVTMKRVGAPC